MKFLATILLSLVLHFLSAQKEEKENLFGHWKLKGVLLQNEVVSFYNADVLIEKLLLRWKAEHPGMHYTKGDSVATYLGATLLCELLYNMELEINNKSELVFKFHIRKNGRVDDQMQVLKFVIANDSILNTVDEKGNKSELKIIKLSKDTLILSGISSARNMELYFKRQ